MGIPPASRQQVPRHPETSRDLEPDARITLGTARISPINMANAYATHRQRRQARRRARDREGRRRAPARRCYSLQAATERAIDEDIAADTSYALQQVVQNGTGTAALALGRPAAGKTGTATNGKDAGLLGLVRRLHPAAVDRGDVRPR